MPYRTFNEKKLYFAARGFDRTPLLLLIHGAAGSHLDWPAQLRIVSDMASCAIDLPGHGRSDKPGRTSVSAYADEVIAFAGSLQRSDIVLVGHSMGGAIALDMAIRQPELVAGLVLVATGARLRVKSALLDLVADDFERVVELVTAMAWSQDAPAEVVDRGQALMLGCDPAAVEMDYTACNSFDLMADLSSVITPTLVITGSEDRLTPPKYGEFLAQNISGAEYVAISGAGHMLAQERPRAVADTIVSFVKRRLSR